MRSVVKLLYPGMRIKRYLALLILGIAFMALGIAYVLTQVYRTQPFPEYVGSLTLQFIDRPVRGVLFFIVGTVIAGVGLEPVRWLVEPVTIKPAITLLVVWHEVGWYMVIFLAGLQSIPQDLYDAASVDGAGSWGRFWHITIPMLGPVILFTVVIDIIGELQIFGEPFVLVGPSGGAGRQGLTMAMYLFQNAFVSMKMGYASAQAYVMFAMIAILSLLNVKVFGRPGGR